MREAVNTFAAKSNASGQATGRYATIVLSRTGCLTEPQRSVTGSRVIQPPSRGECHMKTKTMLASLFLIALPLFVVGSSVRAEKKSAGSDLSIEVVGAVFNSLAAASIQYGYPSSTQQPRERQQRIRELTLRALEKQQPVEKQDQRVIMALVEKVQEDFRRIQIVRNEMVRNLTANERLDYRFIEREVSEVNKRAQGLKERLFAPSPIEDPKDHEQRVEYTKELIKEALIKLCNLIYHFVDSPAFTNADVTDASH